MIAGSRTEVQVQGGLGGSKVDGKEKREIPMGRGQGSLSTKAGPGIGSCQHVTV